MTPEARQIIGLYRRHAREWATDRGNRLFETPWLDRFLALQPAGRKILDIGCGSGQPICRHLISRDCTLTGVDSSPELIGICKENFPDQEWLVADMRSMALGRRFNGILAWDSFFHLCHDDQRGMFPIFAKHTAPRAALMFTSGPSHGEAIGDFHGERLYHASLDPAEYISLLDQNGFAVVDHVIEDPTCGLHTIWLAQRR